jgi:hypothetical protein
MGWSLIMPQTLADDLWRHLFRDDDDEHGAAILAGVASGPTGPRLIARELIKARDGIDYVQGVYGYRRLTSEFVRSAIIRARDEGLAYLAVHNHGGSTAVGFSGDDRASHSRGYPALLDIARGQPVGALVLASGAVAGDLWLGPDRILALSETRLVGSTIRRLYPQPRDRNEAVGAIFDRQTRIFGAAGQELLQRARVGVLGAGGGGMLLVEYLARLGVGEMIVVDPDRVSETNVPRLPGVRAADVHGPFGRRLGRLFGIRGRRKVRLAERLAREANPAIRFTGLAMDVADPDAAATLRDVDFLFCAADTMRARLVFNALVQQYGIPGIQIGAKVTSYATTGELTDVRSVVRVVLPGVGCLWCNGLISPRGLAEESLSTDELAAQRYVDDATIAAPAVITLNAIAASLAANDFLLAYTGMATPGRAIYLTVDHRRGRFVFEVPRRDEACPECGLVSRSRLARGDGAPLPTLARRRAEGIAPLTRRVADG